MARTKFPVEVLTPDGNAFDDEVELLSTRTAVGSIGILANHTPLLAMLDPAELRLYRSDSEVVRFAQAEGYLQIAANRALVLVEAADPSERLDAGELRDKLGDAEDRLSRAEEGSEERAVAQRDKRRWETFLAIAEDSAA